MSILQSSENFAKERHAGMILNDGTTPHYEHLAAVVARLKNLGIMDEEVLAAAWLHDIVDYTNTTFDEIEQRFGSKVGVLVLAVSKDKSLPKSKQEEQYMKQLKESSFEAKLIKVCDISANFKDLKKSTVSKKKKVKEVKKSLHYLNIMKLDLIKNKSQVPSISNLITGINEVITSFGLRSLMV